MTSRPTMVKPRVYAETYPSGKPYWLVAVSLPDGSRYRKKHATAAEAEKDAVRLVALYASGTSSEEIRAAQLAQLYLSTSDNEDAKQAGLAEVVKWAVGRFVASYKVKPVSELVEQLLELKRTQGRRLDTIRELERMLGIFAAELGHVAVTDFNQEMLEEFVGRHANGARSLRRWQNHLKHFFDFLCGTSKLSPNPAPTLKFSPIRSWALVSYDEDETEHIIALGAGECRQLIIAAATHNVQRMMVWLLFSGMRPFEAQRFWKDPELGWKAINLNKRVISVPARIAKTRRPRKIQIRPVLASWLERYRAHGDWSGSNWRDSYREIRSEVLRPEKRVPTIARHTFISMLIESGEPWAKIELQCGNTKDIQLQHYAQLLESPAEADAFWALFPEKFSAFDVSEEEWAAKTKANRTRTILENRKKIRPSGVAKQVVDFLRRSAPLNARQLAEMCEVSSPTIYRALRELFGEGRVMRTGSGYCVNAQKACA